MTEDYKGLQRVRLQGVTRGYKGLHRVTSFYKR